MFRTYIETTGIYSLLNCLGGSSVCFGSIETSKLSVSVDAKQQKQTVLKQTEKKLKKRKNRKKREKTENPIFSVKNSKICSLSNCFGWSSVCFGSIKTSKLSGSVQMRNNGNKLFVSDSAETSFGSSFGSSFGCFESKLASKHTLVAPCCSDMKTRI